MTNNTTVDYQKGFSKGYKEGREDGEERASCVNHAQAREEGYHAAYQEALVKGFERGCAVMSATGVGFATGIYWGSCHPFRGRRAQLILLGDGRVRAQFLVGEDWEMRSTLLFKVEEWQIDQDSILEIPDA